MFHTCEAHICAQLDITVMYNIFRDLKKIDLKSKCVSLRF
jgi:hypothetical protein